MIHHFADLLDRKDDYWAMVPNRERFAFAINGPVADKQSLQIATIGADTPFWEQIFECGDLQELTLHLPSKEQIAALPRLRQLKRLRITRVQVKNNRFSRRAAAFAGARFGIRIGILRPFASARAEKLKIGAF
ncbi:hypothetical protein [uncultured Campylobacter sp.]|uniref:hypothetical protein n=1 Tax=uncultured Campylobacter sp. TaxID=218934 RepID=UPI0026207B80|nr:hypothetical protein [uncultured Campylobacter sp.]